MAIQPEQKYTKSGSGRGISRPRRFLLLIAVIGAFALMVRSQVFVVKEIEVTGNSSRSDSEIAGLSGLSLGMNIFSIDKKYVEGNLSADRYVELLDVSIRLPDAVYIEVRERTPCAAVNCAGVILLIDREGNILERLDSLPNDKQLILVTGMDTAVNSQSAIIESGEAGQTALVCRLLEAIAEAQIENMVSELNVSDPENLYLMSQSGIQVLLGDEEQLGNKLIWMHAVLEELTGDGVMKGVLDVSSGKNAVYSRQ